ncbi:hypothetical protein RW1_049_00010 [Rhodococcus wratislaviensis NBRC 100605]|uniref:Uncharacterized protein n=1 Tax=Rhodococcus wratislaviensis NBRC 100605 TaxID=1219028 RepID=X0RAS3_RHOWR|nr:hypothetical protein RW1_049_00010 [Rhodococcus wratislaviensis NBRC 100605]
MHPAANHGVFRPNDDLSGKAPGRKAELSRVRWVERLGDRWVERLGDIVRGATGASVMR